MVITEQKKFILNVPILDYLDIGVQLIIQNSYTKQIYIPEIEYIFDNKIRAKFLVTLPDCDFGYYEYYLVNYHNWKVEDISEDIVKDSIRAANIEAIKIKEKLIIIGNTMIVNKDFFVNPNKGNKCTQGIYNKLDIYNRGILNYSDSNCKHIKIKEYSNKSNIIQYGE